MPSNDPVKMWAKLGPRAVYGQELLNLALGDSRIVAMSADLGTSSGLERFRQKIPDRFINVGIAEQHLVSMAAGLANEGYLVYASSFAPFLAFRAAEQIRMELGYMRAPVRLVSLGSGLSLGFLGNSHYGLEDLSVMRAIPGIQIFAPADTTELVAILRASTEMDGPMYIRLTGGPGLQPVYEKEFHFNPDSVEIVRDGHGLVILSSGAVLRNVVNSLQILENSGIFPTVLNIHTLKPVNTNQIAQQLDRHTHVAVVEEHSIVGGLGTIVSEVAVKAKILKNFEIFALPDSYGPTASYQTLLAHHKLDSDSLAERLLAFMEN